MYNIDEVVEMFRFYILGSIPHIKQTIDLIEKTVDIEGDYCELGTFIGGNCSMMGYILNDRNKEKMIYMYDSFEGIPYPTEEDKEIPGEPEGVTRTGELKSTGISIASLPWVFKTLDLSNYPRKNFKIIKGWVQNSLPETIEKVTPLAFLRLDLDLYAPTKLSLEYMYDKVVKGGYVFVHDYTILAGCKQAVDEFLEKHPEIEPVITTEGGGIYWVKN